MIWSAIATAWTAFARLPRGWHIAMAVVALCLLAFTLHRCAVSDAREEGEVIGATAQREANLNQTVKNVEKANAAAETVVRDPDAARGECLRNARNPANC